METNCSYPHKYEGAKSIKNILDNTIGTSARCQGRIYSIRDQKKISFADIYDDAKKIQLSFSEEQLGEKYQQFKHDLGKGDIIGVTGTLYDTKSGERTINIENYTLLAKAIIPFRNNWKGLTDVEVRYRNRHEDLLVNLDVRERLKLRSQIIAAIRRAMEACGFDEFETPILQPLYGGADAKPFMTYVNDLDESWYLQISPELYLKRLIIGGYTKVYTITKNFRNESIDSTHNPEFTMMELYQVNADYNDMMVLIEKLISFVNWKIFKTQEFEFKGQKINFALPWKRITMFDSLNEYAGIKIEEKSDEEIKELLSKYGEDKVQRLISNYNRGLAIAKLFDLLVQPKIIDPTFITDYPKETTSLCKAHRNNPDLIERFELFVGGMELANAYSELNDPILQENLFNEQVERKNQGDDEAHPFDRDFIEALKYGMPPTGGLGIGIDRLVMILTGADSIKEVIFWPMLRRENVKYETTDVIVESIAEISQKKNIQVGNDQSWKQTISRQGGEVIVQ